MIEKRIRNISDEASVLNTLIYDASYNIKAGRIVAGKIQLKTAQSLMPSLSEKAFEIDNELDLG